MMPTSASLATDFPADPAQLLGQVRASYPATAIQIGGATWEYIGCGSGPRTLLLLPGALGLADTSFRQILAFAPTWRVISLAYPDTIEALPALLDSIAVVLNLEGAAAVYVVGGSYSGLVAQHFAIRHRPRVAALLLSNTAAPDLVVAARMQSLANLCARIPERLLYKAMRAAIPLFLRTHSPEHRFWRAYFMAAIPRFSKRGLVNRLQLYGQMNRASAIQQWASTPWNGPALIIASENDTFATLSGAQAVRQHCPHAHYLVLSGQGHLAALDSSAAYIQSYQEFLCACTSSSAG